METPTKFTREIKDNWLSNLKSGKYKQGFYDLYDAHLNAYCCIGVLGDCTPGLDNFRADESDPYNFLVVTIGPRLTKELYFTNDDTNPEILEKRDYSNVISLIESLPVQE